MAAWCDHDLPEIDREQAALRLEDSVGTDYDGTTDYGDWFDLGQPDTVVAELVQIVDRLTLHADLLHDLQSLADFGDAA